VQTAGVVGAPLVGGLAGAVDYRLAFVVAALAAVGLATMPVPARPAAGTARPERPRFRDALTAQTRWTAGAAFLTYFAVSGLGVVVALRAGDAFGLGPTARGALLAGFGVAGIVAGRPAGGLTDRRGAVGVAVAGALASVVLVPLLGFAGGAVTLAVVWLAVGVASALLWAGLNVLTVGAAPLNRGGAVSVIGAFKFTGNALAPLAWLAVYDVDVRLAFGCAGVVCVGLAVVVARAGTVAAGAPGARGV
jgi:MFS family permease